MAVSLCFETPPTWYSLRKDNYIARMLVLDVLTTKTIEIILLDLPRSSCYNNLSSDRKNDLTNYHTDFTQ